MSNGKITNHKIVLQERPQRGPITDRTFKRVSEELGELQDGEVRVRIDYVSIVGLLQPSPIALCPVYQEAVGRDIHFESCR